MNIYGAVSALLLFATTASAVFADTISFFPLGATPSPTPIASPSPTPTLPPTPTPIPTSTPATPTPTPSATTTPAATATPTPGASATPGISFLPSKDNTLYLDLNGQLSNGQGPYLYAGRTSNDLLRRGLVAFNLTSVPTNATITGVTFSMFSNRPRPNDTPVNVSLNRALRDWGEGASNAGDPGGIGAQAEPGDATWLHTFYDTSFWTTPGGDFSPTVSATTPVTDNAVYTWSGGGLIADVQSWVSNPATNFGWFIFGDEMDSGTAQRFNTRENANDPPQLTITYHVSTSTPTPTPTPSPTPAPAQALNISTRMQVQTGNNVLIGGFIITGNAPKSVAIRGIGPSLAQFGISDVLADPTLELHAANGSLLAQDDNWQDDPVQAAQLTALGLAPQDPNESGIVATLQPASYTAILAGKNQTTGVGVVEVYDTNRAADSQLSDISTRGFVLTGNNVMIGGFILGGSNGIARVAVRGIGPSLGQFGLSPVLADPTLELRDANGALLVSNDDWQDDPVSASELAFLGLAPSDPRESGIFTSLPPGSFTAILAGKNGGTGIGLVEAYALR